MKYLICSDVHGSIDSFSKVVELFKSNNFDKLIILGDLLYHGPRNDIPFGYAPKEVIKLANSLKEKIIMVKGNCEAEVDQMVLDFHIFNKKKLVINKRNFYLVHGHHLDKYYNEYKKDDVVLYGHTHVSKFEKINDVFYINPGSITLPKENTKKSCISLDNNVLMLMNLDGSIIEKYSI
ncbi:MAG: phosphodiesterase [Bacillales bacterium]|nr:phosphodiesterase [Bacillales bacterium]